MSLKPERADADPRCWRWSTDVATDELPSTDPLRADRDMAAASPNSSPPREACPKLAAFAPRCGGGGDGFGGPCLPDGVDLAGALDPEDRKHFGT